MTSIASTEPIPPSRDETNPALNNNNNNNNAEGIHTHGNVLNETTTGDETVNDLNLPPNPHSANPNSGSMDPNAPVNVIPPFNSDPVLGPKEEDAPEDGQLERMGPGGQAVESYSGAAEAERGLGTGAGAGLATDGGEGGEKGKESETPVAAAGLEGDANANTDAGDVVVSSPVTEEPQQQLPTEQDGLDGLPPSQPQAQGQGEEGATGSPTSPTAAGGPARKLSFKEQVKAYAKIHRGTILGKAQTKETGQKILSGELDPAQVNK